jgi:tetratricopeptide (TPR) repeat protein
MNALERAQSLADTGLFADALGVLAGGGIPRDRRFAADLLRAELLERSGQYQTASESVEAALKHPDISGADQSRCHLTLGRIAAANGNFEAAAAELQRSTSVALFSRDFEHAAWSQLRLLIMLLIPRVLKQSVPFCPRCAEPQLGLAMLGSSRLCTCMLQRWRASAAFFQVQSDRSSLL